MWFLLTDHLVSYTRNTAFSQGGSDLIVFFKEVVAGCGLDRRINQLKYVQIAINCSRQFESMHTLPPPLTRSPQTSKRASLS